MRPSLQGQNIKTEGEKEEEQERRAKYNFSGPEQHPRNRRRGLWIQTSNVKQQQQKTQFLDI